MTTEKDAMALAVIETAGARIRNSEPLVHGRTQKNLCSTIADELREARAHLAARLGELEAEVQAAESARMRWVQLHEAASSRATRAEAELAAVRPYYEAVMNGVEVYDALDKRATNRTGPENVSDTLDAVARVARAAVDAARGGAKS